MEVLTADDQQLLTELHAHAHGDPMQFVERMHAYYYDKDRAERTPREAMYLHLGMLAGVVARLTADVAVARARRP